MHSSSLLYLLLSLHTLALAAPSNITRAGAANGTTSSQACSEGTILAQGIAMNIADQKNEQAALAKVKSALAATPVNTAEFETAKTNLLSFVNKGISVRQMNQQITPAGNAAADGLAIVAKAQATELELSQNLIGDPTKDNPSVASLEKDFAGGIEQNLKNQAAATAGCSRAAVAQGDKSKSKSASSSSVKSNKKVMSN